MTGHVHTPAEWAEMVSLAVAAYGALSVPYFLAVDADLKDFDPRPALARSESPLWQALVFAGHDLNRAVGSARHELDPAVHYARHNAYRIRETARDVAALLILLVTTPKGTMS